MKKISKKGFTLIELLAVIIILGVLILIAVPAINKYVQRSRIRTYNSNLAKFVDAVSIEVNSYDNQNYQFGSNEILVVPFSCIELERGSNTRSPFSPYVKNQSFVAVERNDTGFTYYVTAMDSSGFGNALSAADKTDVKSLTAADISSITNSSESNYTVDFKNLSTTKTAKVYACDEFKES